MASPESTPQTPASPLAGDGDHFAVTYTSARTKFIEAALEVPGCTLYSFRVGSASQKGVDAEDLYIDFAVIRGFEEGASAEDAPVQPENMLIHCSGVQGVDGYVGSGAQVALLQSLAEDKNGQLSKLQPHDCLVFVHAVNPYGFSWWRLSDRCRHGVNISRNFVVKPGSTLEDGERFQQLKEQHNAAYQQEIQTSYAACCGMVTRSRKPDKQRVVKLARLHGQYCNKHGVFYGGSQMRQETKIVLDFLWDLGLRPDNAALKNLAFVQVTAGPGDKHVKESIVCPTRSMQVDVHNLGVGQLEDASVSALEDLEEDLLEAWTGCCGGTKEEDDTAPKTRSAERHTSVFVAGTREFPTSLEGTLLQAVLQQAPQAGAPGATCPDGEGHADQVKRDATMPCEVAARHLGAPQPLAGSDAAPRRVGAGRWTPNQLPEDAGCSSVFAALQQFTTSSEEATLKAVRKEHAAAEKDQALPLYAEERMNLRDAVFEDNIKLRTRVAKRSWKLLSALTQVWRKETAGEPVPAPESQEIAAGEDTEAGDDADAAGEEAIRTEADAEPSDEKAPDAEAGSGEAGDETTVDAEAEEEAGTGEAGDEVASAE